MLNWGHIKQFFILYWVHRSAYSEWTRQVLPTIFKQWHYMPFIKWNFKWSQLIIFFTVYRYHHQLFFASAWFFCSSTLMILSDFHFSADHTQFDVQKQTVQLNREKRTFYCFYHFYQCGKHFYGLYSVLLLSTFSSLVVVFSLWLLKFLLHACAAGTSSALYSFICSYSGFGIFSVSIDFGHFLFLLWTVFVDTVSTCAVIFAVVSNVSTFTSTVFIDCYFFLLLFTLFLLIFSALCLSCPVVSNVSTFMSDCTVSTISTLYCFNLLCCNFCFLFVLFLFIVI